MEDQKVTKRKNKKYDNDEDRKAAQKDYSRTFREKNPTYFTDYYNSHKERKTCPYCMNEVYNLKLHQNKSIRCQRIVSRMNENKDEE